MLFTVPRAFFGVSLPTQWSWPLWQYGQGVTGALSCFVRAL